jgi:hypothetical protein
VFLNREALLGEGGIPLNELVDLITQRTGMSNDMSQKVVQIVEGYLRNKLPEPMGSQVMGMLGSKSSSGGNPMGNIMGDMGNMGQNQPPQR